MININSKAKSDGGEQTKHEEG